jgi:hypothetical protein
MNFVDPTNGFGGFAKEWCQTNFHSSRLVHEISFGFDLVFVIPTSLSLYVQGDGEVACLGDGGYPRSELSDSDEQRA